MHHAEPVDLIFFGNFISEQARMRFWYLIHTLPWTSTPQVRPPKAPEQWTKTTVPSPVFISLSKFEKEDFGVSIAQAQAAGWPVILSDWGGHRDVLGSNVIRVPPRLIADYRESPSQQSRSAQRVAKFIMTKLNLARRKAAKPPKEMRLPTKPPQPVTWDELRRLDLAIHGVLYGKRDPRGLKKKYLRIFGGA
jgi:hypothetical protein